MERIDGQLLQSQSTILSCKKRKKSNGDIGLKGKDKSEEEDDGYKTDEEQWGGNRHVDGHPPGSGPFAAHKALSPKTNNILSASKKISFGSTEDPPTKQARFSIDYQRTKPVGSVDELTQPLSSLSGSDSNGNPGAVNTASRIPCVSNPHAVDLTVGSAPMDVSGPSSESVAARRNERTATHTESAEPDKRKERNAREKERSCRIARQIDDLRALLSRGGVVVSKGTKSSVLAEAANYINLLQQQQAQWEM